MIDWTLGLIAECAYYAARFHERRAERDKLRAARFIARARHRNEKAEWWARVQRWADRVDGPFDAAPIIEGPHT